MKLEQKKNISRQKITAAALLEFGARGYEGASINVVCKSAGISKGLVYHYFKGKDDLYLACIAECFFALTEHLKKTFLMSGKNIENNLQEYFGRRAEFFEKNAQHKKLFYEALASPPEHLTSSVLDAKRDFDKYNEAALQELIKDAPLRSGITKKEIINFFKLFHDFINSNAAAHHFSKHEKIRSRAVSVLLYGVLDCGEEKRKTGEK